MFNVEPQYELSFAALCATGDIALVGSLEEIQTVARVLLRYPHLDGDVRIRRYDPVQRQREFLENVRHPLTTDAD